MREDWAEIQYKDAVTKVSTSKQKLKQKEYSDFGDYPVVDQGQDIIGGYSNDKNRLLDCDLPVLVFGDHTKCVKLINFTFIPGADGTKVLEAKSGIDPKFLSFITHVLVHRIKDKGYARHYQHLEKENFPLPPLPFQRAIVSKIETLFSDLDKGIEDLNKAKDQLKIYRQAVLKKAFEGELTGVKLERVRIDSLGKIVTGNTPPKNDDSFYNSRDYNFYKPTDLEKGLNVFESNDFLSQKGFESSRQVPENSILVTCIGATIGKTGLVCKPGGFNQQINAIIPESSINPKFIFFQAISLDFQTQIKINASSTTLPILNKNKFSSLTMQFCSPKDQHRIVREIESRLSVCDQVERSINESLEKAKALRQSILKKAFEGKLLTRVEIERCKKEKDYEPASQLLARIKQANKPTKTK